MPLRKNARSGMTWRAGECGQLRSRPLEKKKPALVRALGMGAGFHRLRTIASIDLPEDSVAGR